MKFLISLVLAFGGTVAILNRPDLLGILCGGAMWFASGGVTALDLVSIYRKQLGLNPDPLGGEL